jgi:hypothetical protein
VSNKIPQPTKVLIDRLRRVAKCIDRLLAEDWVGTSDAPAWKARANTCWQSAARLEELESAMSIHAVVPAPSASREDARAPDRPSSVGAPHPQPGWQPIATHDGSFMEVIVATEDAVGEARYRGEDGWWWINNDPTDVWGERIYPTHWLPLPDPPSVGAPHQEEQTAETQD